MTLAPAPVLLPWTPQECATKWAVYEVLTGPEHDAKSIWVGCDPLHSMLKFEEANTTPAFRSTVKNSPDARVMLIGLFDQQTEARRLQFEYRKLRNPIGNQQWVARPTTNRQNGTGVVVCVETGEQYRNSAEAARANGVAPGTMSNHLLQRRGYARVNGLTFKRVKGAC